MSKPPPAAAADWLDQLGTAVAVLDERLTFIWANPAFCELIGLGLRRLVAQPLSVLRALDPQLEQQAGHVMEQQGTLWINEVGICAVPGVERVLDLNLAVHGARLLLEARPAVPAASPSRLSGSLRGFAHEVKNPLAAISGAAQLLQQRESDPRQRELAELILRETNRLAALADRLLGARATLMTRAINVHALLEHLAQLLSAERADIEIVRDYDPSLPALHGDPDRLLQVLLNLARNALEANARRIVLRSRAEAGLRNAVGQPLPAIRIEVEDDGDGVPAALASNLFEPMVSGRPDGSGLGLALAREVAREHGGELSHQRRGEATCFVLLLPRHPRASAPESSHG